MPRLVTATVVLFVLFAPAVAQALPVDPLRPGDPIGSPATCTLSFVFRDASATYMGTAKHCVGAPGAVVSNLAHGRFGVVDTVLGGVDFALIRLDADEPADPRVIDVGGPTGVASKEATATGDVLAAYGHGAGVGIAVQTRPRLGVLVGDNQTEFWWDTVTTPGDSGAPVVVRGSGLALGIVSRVGVVDHTSTDTGPTIAHVLARLAAAGRPVVLETAPR